MKKGNENNVKTNEKKKKHYIAEKSNTKVKKENIFKKISKYFKGVLKEFNRIRWTSWRDLGKYSICTLVFVFFFAVYFHAIDWVALLIRSLAN